MRDRHDTDAANGKTEAPQAIWCLVANVREQTAFGEGEQDVRRGAKHFPPGAKVYCFPPLWGDGYEKIKVIGHHRGSHRFATMVIDSKYLERWRAELVYSPHVIRQFAGRWDGSRKSKREAELLASWKTVGSLDQNERAEYADLERCRPRFRLLDRIDIVRRRAMATLGGLFKRWR